MPSVAKTRTIFRCTDCGTSAPKWVGRCAGCESWNTLIEEIGTGPAGAGGLERVLAAPPVPITELDGVGDCPHPTGVSELDRVLGGGLVPGSVTLVGGEPGIGKSTLLLEASAAWARSGGRVLYVSAEESVQQVRRRAERLGAVVPGLWLASDSVLESVISGITNTVPDLVIIDSIQAMFDPQIGSAPGSVVQVRECAHALVRLAKERCIAVVLVGHVTKDGALAGPRVLEHVVDTVLSFEGDRQNALRLLRASKHRFGSTSELGVFEMGESGLRAVEDPSGMFLADRCVGIPGSVVVPTTEGHRPLVVEVQALAGPSSAPLPRRSAQGVDGGRLAMLLAMLDKRMHAGISKCDVYVSVAGGVKVAEPGLDLGVAMAVVSSLTGHVVPENLVAFGEIGLGGELRHVGHAARRLTEAARLGFHRAVVPSSCPKVPGIVVVGVDTFYDALMASGFPAEVF
ncbi:MAG: repair protein RadA [Acidimicrobiia bacterium]|nr:repair protein RadA [Acidimicrobiia bacterium]